MLFFLLLCSRILPIDCCRRRTLRCYESMLCAPFLRSFLELFLELSLACSLCLYTTFAQQTPYPKIGPLLSVSLIVILVLLATKLMNITAYPSHELKDPKSHVSRYYGEAYSRLEVKRGFFPLNYFTWFLFRRFAIVLLIVFLQSHPGPQIWLHILLGIIDIMILTRVRPFALRCDQAFHIINAVVLLIVYSAVLALYMI